MFFSYFNQIASPGVDYNLTITKTDDGRLVVSLLSKVRDLKDPAQHHIRPMTLSGTPQELDQGFFPTVTAPVQKASGLLVGMADYEKQLDKAADESKAAKKERDEATKAVKAKKEKYDGHIKKAEEMEAAGNFDDAIIQLQQARLHATDKAAKTIDEKIAAIRGKMGQGSLFGEEPVLVQPVPVQPLQPVTAAPAPVSETILPAAVPQPVPTAQVSVPMTVPTPEPAPANGQAFGVFGPQLQQQPAPQPHTAPSDQPQPTVNHHQGYADRPLAAAPAYRESDYAEIQDFPSEMLPPPVYPGNQGAMAF